MKNSWIVDIYGNRNSVEFWGSEENAQVALDSLVNCTNCSNCLNCESCYNCVACYNCKACRDCSICLDCESCYNCEYCFNAKNKNSIMQGTYSSPLEIMLVRIYLHFSLMRNAIKNALLKIKCKIAGQA
jgi:hypothetical protein